jgi:hypothetical protein
VASANVYSGERTQYGFLPSLCKRRGTFVRQPRRTHGPFAQRVEPASKGAGYQSDRLLGRKMDCEVGIHGIGLAVARGW